MAGERVLVVEDNEKNMKLFRDVLQATGYSTLEATTGEDAVELALSREPALVLMDVQLPGIDGVEALARLRRDGRTASIPVLALTAQAMHGDRERFLEAGFDEPDVERILELVPIATHNQRGRGTLYVGSDQPVNAEQLANPGANVDKAVTDLVDGSFAKAVIR